MLAREHYLRQQARRAVRERRRRRLNIAIGIVVALILIVAVGWLLKAKVFDDDEPESPSTDSGALTAIQQGVAS